MICFLYDSKLSAVVNYPHKIFTVLEYRYKFELEYNEYSSNLRFLLGGASTAIL